MGINECLPLVLVGKSSSRQRRNQFALILRDVPVFIQLQFEQILDQSLHLPPQHIRQMFELKP